MPQIGHVSIAEITLALLVDRKDRATGQTVAPDLVHTQKDRPNVTNTCLYPENGTLRATDYPAMPRHDVPAFYESFLERTVRHLALRLLILSALPLTHSNRSIA